MKSRRWWSATVMASLLVLSIGVWICARSIERESSGGSGSHIALSRFKTTAVRFVDHAGRLVSTGVEGRAEVPATGDIADSDKEVAQLTDEQRAQIRPMLDALENILDMARADGDGKRVALVVAERKRLVRAVKGLRGQQLAVR